ncbi:glycosyltransferase [Mesorhizobium sp. ZMM04-5]|uniref:Glycosyltransferase n=1 Tax=Mesorhizobium marinum TaxID=3228790 RepID=A0ABV3R0P3_9HYPH
MLDHVKFARRYGMLEALKDTPITLVTDRKVENLAGNVRVEAPRSAKDLMALMGRSKVVVCPSSHALGFHEYPFMAFTMGATVISAPNGPLEGAFSNGTDILFFRDAHSLRASVNQALQHPEIGLRGREKALSQFLPARLVEVIFNSPAVQA